MRLIDADRQAVLLKKAAAKLLMSAQSEYDTGWAKGLIDAADTLANAPTIEARRVVRGEWKQSILADDFFRCSVCSSVWNRKFEFCPHCGADMRGVEDAD